MVRDGREPQFTGAVLDQFGRDISRIEPVYRTKGVGELDVDFEGIAMADQIDGPLPGHVKFEAMPIADADALRALEAAMAQTSVFRPSDRGGFEHVGANDPRTDLRLKVLPRAQELLADMKKAQRDEAAMAAKAEGDATARAEEIKRTLRDAA